MPAAGYAYALSLKVVLMPKSGCSKYEFILGNRFFIALFLSYLLLN
ncbi:hypothetical protein COO91_07933 [Nostoc flagelliforme CCNUN1]|uniref:Uncharacterized protein n=1 Tax=Nostoc flagelliforme CCNUN1 TaxID=2038116 RepID=A0A2K8T2F3_9NOSO|nr:hypothetical protein COO91_07933 [Nostoc flagelliforme CCNUN1]